MKELHSVVLMGLGAITARGDFTLRPGTSPVDAEPADNSTLTIEGFKLDDYLASQKTYLDRCSALALAGCALALRDAGIEWPLQDEVAESFGITLGTHLGCVETMQTFWKQAIERGLRLANPLLFSHSYFNTPISLCAIEFGLKGYHTTFCAGHESGLEAVRAAYDAIRLGHAAAMLCGGVEAVTPMRQRCEAETVLGEAATFFVLESATHAEQRGASISQAVAEAWFEAALAERAAIRAQFGDCGGAESTLCLLRAAVQAGHLYSGLHNH